MEKEMNIEIKIYFITENLSYENNLSFEIHPNKNPGY